jgi:hypothetical protein
MKDPVIELARRRRGSQHTRETVREVRAEHLPREVMELMSSMADEINTLKARLHRFETALIEAAQEHTLREPQL